MFPAGRRFIGRFGQAGKDGFFRVRFILRRFIGQLIRTEKNVGNAVLHSAKSRFNNRRGVFAKKARYIRDFPVAARRASQRDSKISVSSGGNGLENR